MKIAPKLVLAASAIAITGTLSVLGSSPSAGAADQCPSGLGKVETSGQNNAVSVFTGLPAGTSVCIKVGNETTFVTVDANGFITNTSIRNKNGVLQAISNYVWYTTPTTTTVAPTTTMATTTTTMAPTTTMATTTSTLAPTTKMATTTTTMTPTTTTGS
jgi:hypothetical protein